MTRAQTLLQNYAKLQRAICAASKPGPQKVTLLAVTKYAQDKDVLFLLEQGLLSAIGESRVQQAWARWHENPAFAAYAPRVQKHLIGHLQKNKAAKAAVLFDWVDSIDDLETARVLSIHAPTAKTIRVLVQVKLTHKDTQYGLPLKQARQLAKTLAGRFDNIDVCGYMAVAPQGAAPQELRALFKQVASAYNEDFKNHPHAALSLGMSEDFEIAVKEGSTLPRIGSLLFSENLEEA